MIHDKTKYTPEEYLAREEKADYKSEYYDGEILMMAGGTEDHSLISVNTVIALSNALRGKPCRVYNSDMRLSVASASGYVYPDVMVICGKTTFQQGRQDTVTNPIVIVEVLSSSTRERDRIEKFALYKQIDSVQEYIQIDSERLVVFVLRRQRETGMWTIEIMNDSSAVLVLESLGVKIPLTELYDKIDFQTNQETKQD